MKVRPRRASAVLEARQWLPDDPQACGALIGWLMCNDVPFRCVGGTGGNTRLAIRYPGMREQVAAPGDWVLEGILGAFFVRPASVFDEVYEESPDPRADLGRIAGRIVPPNEMRRREGL